MDSNRIKNLATGARTALSEEVEARLTAILAEGSSERLDQQGKVHRIEEAVAQEGRERVVDSAAYTWFNRLCALRYMDVKGYTPIGVVTPKAGDTQPAILADAMQGVFDPEFHFSRLVKDEIVSLLTGAIPSNNPTEAAYAVLLTAVCDYFAGSMSYLFKEDVASSLLMPQGLLSEGSILRRIIEDMDDDTCESVEVLGWLYQYYIAERKDQIFASKAKRGAEEIAPATQLFTPNWIVRYMTENSLGRIWMLNRQDSELKESMDYYIDSERPSEYLKVYTPEEIKVLDPACGSGHILVYAFDLLFRMYEEDGWQPEEIPAMILQNNLFGFEIDGRAGEIARFALEMKARERDPKFFDKHIDAMVTVLEPVRFSDDEMEQIGLSDGENDLLTAMSHLDEIGSLYVPKISDGVFIDNAIDNLGKSDSMFTQATAEKLQKIKTQVQKLSQTFSAVIANPPYIGTSSLQPWAKKWVQEKYPDAKPDFFAAFVLRNLQFAELAGELGFMTPYVWMFISSYESLRSILINEKTITSLVQLEYSGFEGATVPICTFTLQNTRSEGFKGGYIRLADFTGPGNQAPKTLEAIRNPNCGWFYHADSKDFQKIPHSPIAYWAKQSMFSVFESMDTIERFAPTSTGMKTGENATFLRLWWEIGSSSFKKDAKSIEDSIASKKKWFPYNKGGDFRKWYGNNIDVINWKNDGCEIKDPPETGVRNFQLIKPEWMFRPHITWTKITSSTTGFRLKPCGHLFDMAGASIVINNRQSNALLAFCNSSVAEEMLRILSPTLNVQSGDVGSMPFDPIDDENVRDIVDENISLSRTDWDSFETSWDFLDLPLIRWSADNVTLERAYELWKSECNSRFSQLKANEEELNRVFTKIYSMEGEIPTDVPLDKISVHYEVDSINDLPECWANKSYVRTKRDEMISLISYAVGCLFGRYSTEKPGLILADQGSTLEDFIDKVSGSRMVIDSQNEHHSPIDIDGILPILDGEWFADDIVTEIKNWLRQVYGEDYLEQNLGFIEDALGKDLRTYLVKDFYDNHIKVYQKRPIYWLFSSPKKSFSCLIYLHRYNESTVGQILTGYLRPYIEKLNGEIMVLEASDKASDHTQADKYRTVVAELTDWERDVIHPMAQERISIDLDDGVKVNYNKFPKALRKIAGLSEWK